MQIVLALLIGGTTLAKPAPPPPRLAPERVRAAIEYGRGAGESQLAQYEIKTADTWLVNCDTAFLRVAQLAASQQKSQKTLAESEVPDAFASNEVHVYVHARFQAQTRSLPNIDYVMLARPVGSRLETVLPRSLDRFVRQVPPDPTYFGPARIAKSVRAAFLPQALQAGGHLRIVFEGGAIETVPLDEALLARIK